MKKKKKQKNLKLYRNKNEKNNTSFFKKEGMLSFVLAALAAGKGQPEECAEYIDLTNVIYDKVDLVENTSVCLKTRGSLFVDGKGINITGYKDNAKILNTKGGVAAVFANPDLENNDYFFTIESTENKTDVLLYGSLNIPYDKKVVISTKPYFEHERLIERNIREAYLFILGIHDDSILEIETDDFAEIDYKIYTGNESYDQEYRHIRRDREIEIRSKFTYIEIKATATRRHQEIEVEFQKVRRHRYAAEFANPFHGSIRVQGDGILSENDFHANLTNINGLTQDNGPSTPDNNNTPDNGSGVDAGLIAGIVLGIVMVIAVIVIVVVIVKKKQDAKKETSEPQEDKQRSKDVEKPINDE